MGRLGVGPDAYTGSKDISFGAITLRLRIHDYFIPVLPASTRFFLPLGHILCLTALICSQNEECSSDA
jgi:hypothetical protein